MVNIDYIMDLLDWNRSREEMEYGLQLAREVKCINVFLQPVGAYGKNVWDNCAKVLAEKTDEELKPYLLELMEWIADLNWPGAFCILERLQQYKEDSWYQHIYNISLKYARALEDEVWESNLKMIEKSC